MLKSHLQLSLQWSPVIDEADFRPELYLAPNPHLADFCDAARAAKEVSQPYSESISAGKNTHVYDAHTYHTKVPPQGIEKLIEYYTRPGDVVLDPFCGSGMTGIAATETGRKAVLSDLSPAATFIAWNLNTPLDADQYLEAVDELLARAEALEHTLYDTHCRACQRVVPLLYTVWSFSMICSHCEHEFVLWEVARDEKPRVKESKIKTKFACPHCQQQLCKKTLKRTRRYPVQVGYKCCGRGLKETTAPPDEFDLARLQKIEEEGIPADLWYPTAPFPEGINTRQPIAAGIETIDKAYLPRALWAMAFLWQQAQSVSDTPVRNKLLFTLTSLYQRVTVFSEFRFWGGSGNIANFNVPAIMNEQNVFRTFARKARTISWYFKHATLDNRRVQVSTQSALRLPQLPDRSVDYVFTDPPFGSNINYSEMNFLWESWLQVYTDNTEEAIINKVQKKSFAEYQELLTAAFAEMRRVLKDNGWLTVVFHNSSERVWTALQAAISHAGFVIRGTQTFDKEHGTFKQFVSDNAVGYDLVLHCQKGATGDFPRPVEKETTRQQAREFIARELRHKAWQYAVRYLHVVRADEFDYRRLYANWLAASLSENTIALSFEQFRVLVDERLHQPGDNE
jgi:DNA modification methylase